MLILRIAGNLLLAVLPSLIKIPIYRLLYRWRIGKRVKIGFGVVFVGVKRCSIDDDVRIACFNLFYRVDELTIGDHGAIGHFNLFRGGDKIQLGAYSTILRGNVVNAILDPDTVNPLESVFQLGTGAVVTTGHWLDFTDRITIGAHTIIGGRNSSFWTHNRQRTRTIHIGEHCYLGSEVRIAPGVQIAPFCIVALGSVLMKKFDLPQSFIAGNPADILRRLNDRDLFLVTHKTRSDLPDEITETQDTTAFVELEPQTTLEPFSFSK